MMKLQYSIEVIAEKLRTVAALSDVPSETALLVTWKQLSRQRRSGIPPIEQVVRGELSLSDAYKRIAQALGQGGDVYISSLLPNNLAKQSTVKVLEYVERIPEVDAFVLVNTLSALAIGNTKLSAELILPDELVKLMVALSTGQGGEVYAPFAASVQLAARLKHEGRKVFYESQQSSSLIIAITSLMEINWSQSDPLRMPTYLENDELKQFSNVLMAPPFGVRYKDPISDPYHRFPRETNNGDVLAIEHGLAQCSGRLVTIAPVGMLFRGANDYDLRKKLVENGWLEAVIQLPAGLLSYTGIPLALLVIDKQRDPSKPVFLCNADQSQWVQKGGRGRNNKLLGWQNIVEAVVTRKAMNHTALVTQNEIKTNEYNLSISRYVLGQASATMRALGGRVNLSKLEDVAKLIRAQALRENKPPAGDEYREVGIKDIGDNGLVTLPGKCLLLSGRAKDRAEIQRLRAGDILLVSKGSVGKIALVGSDCGSNWVASQSYQVIRLAANSPIQAPEYLFRFLASPLAQAYINEQITGTTIPMLSTGDIKGLSVPLPLAGELEKVTQTHQEILAAYDRIHAIQQQIATLNQQHWPLDLASDDAQTD